MGHGLIPRMVCLVEYLVAQRAAHVDPRAQHCNCAASAAPSPAPMVGTISSNPVFLHLVHRHAGVDDLSRMRFVSSSKSMTQSGVTT